MAEENKEKAVAETVAAEETQKVEAKKLLLKKKK